MTSTIYYPKVENYKLPDISANLGNSDYLIRVKWPFIAKSLPSHMIRTILNCKPRDYSAIITPPLLVLPAPKQWRILPGWPSDLRQEATVTDQRRGGHRVWAALRQGYDDEWTTQTTVPTAKESLK